MSELTTLEKNVVAMLASNVINKRYIPLHEMKSGTRLRQVATEMLRRLVQESGWNESGEDTTVRKILYRRSGEVFAHGYNRVVVGDYGAFLEFTPEQLIEQLRSFFGDKTPQRNIKYRYMIPVNGFFKVYHQLQPVRYADYIPGCYYVCPSHLYVRGGQKRYECPIEKQIKELRDLQLKLTGTRDLVAKDDCPF